MCIVGRCNDVLATIAAGLIRGIEKNKRKRQRSGAGCVAHSVELTFFKKKRRQVESCQDDHIINLKQVPWNPTEE